MVAAESVALSDSIAALAQRSSRSVNFLENFHSPPSHCHSQGPLSRFGDTAANEGAMAIMNNHPLFISSPTFVKSAAASAAAAAFRILLMPVDCLKTTLQVQVTGTDISVALKFFSRWRGRRASVF